MTGFDVQTALRQYFRDQLKELRELHLTTSHGHRVHADAAYAPDAHQRDLRSVNAHIDTLREMLATRSAFLRDDQADIIIGEQEVSHNTRVELALGLLQADIQVMEQSREWLTNGLVEKISLVADHSPPPSMVQTVELSSPTPEASPKVSEVLPLFLDTMQKDESWRGQTLMQNKTTYRMFQEVCSDKPVQSYKRRDLTALYDVLRALPADYSKARQWRDMSLVAIVEKSKELDIERLTMRTAQRHFNAIGRLFTYLRKRGEYESDNPAHGFEFPMKGRKNQGRQMWEGERLTKLFNSPVWTGCKSETQRSAPGTLIIKDEKYWMPILGLYHGNRLEEFAQLLRGDVRCTDGIWHFDLNDEDGKHLKNEQSKRRVPIHPVLITMGFLAYVETIAPKPESPIFPQLSPGGPDRKRGFYFTKWWSRYRQAIGVFEKGYDYHSFRHGMTTKLAAAGVSLELRNELLGHEGASTDEKVYLKGLPLEQLAGAIAKVEWSEVDAVLRPKPTQ